MLLWDSLTNYWVLSQSVVNFTCVNFWVVSFYLVWAVGSDSPCSLFWSQYFNTHTYMHTHILYILSSYEVGMCLKNTSHPGNNLLVAKIQCHALQGHRSSKSSCCCCCSIKATMWVWERTQHSVLIVFLFIFSLNKWALHWIIGLNKKKSTHIYPYILF